MSDTTTKVEYIGKREDEFGVHGLATKQTYVCNPENRVLDMDANDARLLLEVEPDLWRVYKPPREARVEPKADKVPDKVG